MWVRLISLEGCPPEFATQVTEATNTQNTVERSDFVALDPEQGRLRTELLLSLQKIYSIKRGEDNPQPEHGCTVTEATVALACSQPNPALAVIAKSAVGRLWESTTRAPYTVLFNRGTSAFRLWRAVQVTRAVDGRLEIRRAELEGRARSVAVQGNRIVLHLVFRKLDLAAIDDPDTDWSAVIAGVPSATDALLDLLISRVESEYSGNYITSLSRTPASAAISWISSSQTPRGLRPLAMAQGPGRTDAAHARRATRASPAANEERAADAHAFQQSPSGTGAGVRREPPSRTTALLGPVSQISRSSWRQEDRLVEVAPTLQRAITFIHDQKGAVAGRVLMRDGYASSAASISDGDRRASVASQPTSTRRRISWASSAKALGSSTSPPCATVERAL